MKRQIKLAVLFLSFLMILPLGAVQAVNVSTEREGIPFDKIPPALLELLKRDAIYYIERGKRAEKRLKCVKQFQNFFEENKETLEKIRFSKPIYDGNSFLNIAYCPGDVGIKNANEKESAILKEYRFLVKRLHDATVDCTSIEQLHKAQGRLEKLDSAEKEQVYLRVLCRYPEFKNYDASQVILYGLLLEGIPDD